MANHYDPHYQYAVEQLAERVELGQRYKDAIIAVPSALLVERLSDIQRNLRSVEKSVIGGEAIDALRDARKALEELVSPSKA